MLAVLGGLLVVVVGYQFIFGVDKPSSTKKSQNSKQRRADGIYLDNNCATIGPAQAHIWPGSESQINGRAGATHRPAGQDLTPLDLNAVLKGTRKGGRLMPHQKISTKAHSPSRAARQHLCRMDRATKAATTSGTAAADYDWRRAAFICCCGDAAHLQ